MSKLKCYSRKCPNKIFKEERKTKKRCQRYPKLKAFKNSKGSRVINYCTWHAECRSRCHPKNLNKSLLRMKKKTKNARDSRPRNSTSNQKLKQRKSSRKSHKLLSPMQAQFVIPDEQANDERMAVLSHDPESSSSKPETNCNNAQKDEPVSNALDTDICSEMIEKNFS
ncbi:hypothetical protein Ahia01_000087100 [Argonauta hians]